MGAQQLCGRREGKAIYYVLMTSGESGEDHQRGLALPPAEIAEIREAEQRLAANIVGVKDVLFLGQPDGRVEPTLAFRDQIVNVLRRLRPQIVMSMDPGSWAFDNFYLYHPDHRATALAVYDAIYPAAGNPCYVPQPDEGLPAHKVREVYFSGTSHAQYVYRYYRHHRAQSPGPAQSPQSAHRTRGDRAVRPAAGGPAWRADRLPLR